MDIYHCDTYLDYIFTVLLYLIIYIDDIVIQHATNNVDACTHCAYLFFVLAVAKLLNRDNKIAFNKVRVELSESLENGKCLS